MTKAERIVIVGAGLAGLRAAEALRELKFTGELVVVGAEDRRPYHRPALSKQLLTGELRASDLTLHSYVRLNARWRRNTPALRLDPRRRVVELPGDEELRYDGLVIATGVQQRHLAGAPRHDRRVHVLRTIDDATALQRTLRARPAERVVVIGGGFTACEVAATASELGREVTIVSRSKTLLGKTLGRDVGNRIARLHRAHGVELALGAEVVHWIPQPRGIALHLSDGQVLLAGCVVLAVGSTPAVQWLGGSGLTLENGVLCRPSCHVAGATDVVAAGDVARWPNLRFEAVPRRAEHWHNAADMGRAAAASLLAGPVDAVPFTPLPRFWSEQHGVRLQVAGMPTLGWRTIPLAGRVSRPRVLGHLRNGRLIGVTAWDSPPEMLRWTAELERELRRPTTSDIAAIAPIAPITIESPPVEQNPRVERLTQLVEWQLSRGEKVGARLN